jgi:hypothetical protein
MSENFNNLRFRSREARLKLEGNYGVTPASDLTSQQAKLASLFSEAAAAREDMISKFTSLSALRVEAYESLVSGYVSSYYASNIATNFAEITVLFRALEIVSSGDFVSNFDSAVYILENSYERDTVSNIASFFSSKFDELVSIAFDDTEISYEVGVGLSEDSVLVQSPSEQENKIYLVLEILGKLKNIDNELIWSDISAYKSYLAGDSKLEFPSILKSNISVRSQAISDLVASKKFMDLHRSESDPAYKPEIDSGLSSVLNSISEGINLFSDLSSEKVEESRSNGSYDRLAFSVAQLESESDDLLSSSLRAIGELEAYLEDYQAFVRLPRDESASVRNAVEVCESADENYANYQEQLQSSAFFSPFSNQSGGRTRLSFSEWVSRTSRARVMNGSIFEMALLFMGTQGRTFLPQKTYKDISNFAFSSMYRKGLIKNEVLSSQYRGFRSLYSRLFSESGVRVSENPDTERLPLAIRYSLPGLEVLDYISYSPALLFSSTAPNASEVSLRNNVRLLILESFGKVRKDRLAETIRSTISKSSSYRRENLKGLYTEACLRDAISAMNDHLEEVGDSYPQRTSIDPVTKRLMESYLADGIESRLDGWLSNYITVHTAIYGSNSSQDLISVALLDGELKTQLIG